MNLGGSMGSFWTSTMRMMRCLAPELKATPCCDGVYLRQTEFIENSYSKHLLTLFTPAVLHYYLCLRPAVLELCTKWSIKIAQTNSNQLQNWRTKTRRSSNVSRKVAEANKSYWMRLCTEYGRIQYGDPSVRIYPYLVRSGRESRYGFIRTWGKKS